MTDYPDWQNALVFNRVIDTLIGQNIPAASSITRPASGKFNIVQPGYEFELNVATLGGTAPQVSVELQWYDSTFGALMDDEIYYFYSGDLNGHLIHGRGPAKGDQLVYIVKNYSGAAAITFSDTVLQVPRVFTREFWKTITMGATPPVFPGLTAAKMNPAAGTLCADSSNLLLSSQKILVLPLYTGTVRLHGLTSDAVAGNSQWEIVNATDQAAGQLILLASAGQSGFAPSGALSAYAPATPLPRAQCTLDLFNHNTTTTETLSTNIVAAEDRA